ncbi:hypothetical protein [Bacillus sp. SM2101]|uniref:hypothetical protein n=1 Tax=Bacillus sp. SM2101 TaxID=2805366 RepID=UPI001BDF571F|nr:hypothetical protein [Bacillus sp. SM2101]
MDFVLEHKWIFLIIAEIFFWVFMISFLTVRYWFGLKKLSMLLFLIFIINDLWIAAMGFFDYLKTGDFTSYQIIILVIIVYALTYGKADAQKLDTIIQQKVALWKGEPIPQAKPAKVLYGKAHAKNQRKQFFSHFLIFAIVHFILFISYGLSEEIVNINSIEQLFTVWLNNKNATFPFNNAIVNNLSRIWMIILTLDAVISLSYSVFPKSNKAASS